MPPHRYFHSQSLIRFNRRTLRGSADEHRNHAKLFHIKLDDPDGAEWPQAGTEKKKKTGYTTCRVLNVSHETRKNVLLSCLSPSRSESNSVVIYLLLVLLDYEERKQQPTFPLEDSNSNKTFQFSRIKRVIWQPDVFRRFHVVKPDWIIVAPAQSDIRHIPSYITSYCC